MTPKDHALAVVKAALNLDPFGVGGAISSLIGDYVPTSQQRSLEEAKKLFFQKVAEIKDRIDTKTLNKDDFAELFNKFEALAKKTNRDEKLRAAANILANALLPVGDPNKSSFTELDHLMHCVDALSSGAITVLGACILIVDQPKTPPGSREPRPVNRSAAKFRFPEIRQKLPDFTPHLILGLATELRSLNLLHITEGAIAAAALGHYLITVTPQGFLFAERFIEGRM
jgi:hypothetical protein